MHGGMVEQGIARRVTPVLRASLSSLFTRRAHVSRGNGRSQVRDDVIMGVIIQYVDPLR